MCLLSVRYLSPFRMDRDAGPGILLVRTVQNRPDDHDQPGAASCREAASASSAAAQAEGQEVRRES